MADEEHGIELMVPKDLTGKARSQNIACLNFA